MVKFIADHYNCQIFYPKNVLNVKSMTDGLVLEFHQIDWECFISNFTMHQIFLSTKYMSRTIHFKDVQTLIESMLIEKIRK